MKLRTAAALVAATTLVTLAAEVRSEELPRRAMFGVQLAPVTPENFAELGLDEATGILLRGVFPDTPAAGAGLQEGDVVLQVDDKVIREFDDFIRAAQSYHGGDEVTLKIRRKSETLEKKFKLATRPLESDPDFDVVYDAVKSGELRLRTVITKPRGAGKHPAILYIQDLGPASIDWFSPQMQNPTRTLLYHLTRAGLVTMRVELAGIGDSEGGPADKADFESHVPHLAAAVARLRQYDFVDADNVFLFGDRIGGVAAPLVAAQAKPKGVIVWSTIGRPYIEARLDASRQHQKLEAYDDEQIEQTLAGLKDILQQVLVQGKAPQDVAAAHPEYAPIFAQVSQAPDMFLGRHVSFWRQVAKLDLAETWKRVACPVLVVWGAGDWTSCQADAKAIADAVNAGHAGQAQYLEVAGLDAMFSKVQDMEESYLAGTPGPFDSRIVDELKKWVAAQKNRPGAQ